MNIVVLSRDTKRPHQTDGRGLEGIEAATGQAIAGEFVKFIERNVWTGFG